MSEFKYSLINVEDCLWVLSNPIGLPVYDFKFEDNFRCNHPIYIDAEINVVARLGATNDYQARYDYFGELGIKLIHTSIEYELSSRLPKWYPLISDLTSKSIWYDVFPSVKEVENNFSWPIFIKGERQTNRHDRSKSIIESPSQLNELKEIWKNDEILYWQKIVCREFINLKKVAEDHKIALPKSFEFRTFWWYNECVGFGKYWTSENYQLSDSEKDAMLKVASLAAKRLAVKFLVIDMALTENNEWIIIECNDGQDAGYAGVNPFLLWSNVVNLCKNK